MNNLIETIGKQAKNASYEVAKLSTLEKNRVLNSMAIALQNKKSEILIANELDIIAGQAKGLSASLLDRLRLTEDRVIAMSQGLLDLVKLPDPVGEIISMIKRPNGLQIGKMRVPLGVLGIIYEARPNVTVDAVGIALKTNNVVVLRGGSEAINSNKIIVSILRNVLAKMEINKNAIQLLENTDRQLVTDLLRANDYIDVIIPRGSADLIRHVVKNATVPVIETGAGNCHAYVEKTADLSMAVAIVDNGKTQRPSVCNALETVLVDEDVATVFLERLATIFSDKAVILHCCKKSYQLLKDSYKYCVPANMEDWYTEYGDFQLAVKIVANMEEAIAHIQKFSTHHSEVIITNDYAKSRKFTQEVDAAAVYVNASTRFTDGSEFGFGAEIGISTQKLHARGPMGLVEMTSVKYIIFGDGQVRA